MTFTPAELTAMRDVQAAHLPDTARHYRAAARVSDGRGGILPAGELELELALEVRLAKPTAAELTLTAERFGRAATWVLTAPHGTGVAAGDRFDLDAELGALTLEVIGTLSVPASWATAERVACIEAG